VPSRICWSSWNLLRRAGVAAGPYAEIVYMFCRRTTPDPSTRFGIGYRGRKRCSAYTRTFSKLSTSLLTDTKSLRRGGPLCPPALPDMLAVMEFVTAGRKRCSAHTRTFLKLSTLLLTDTKSLRRGGPLCPPVLPDMLAVMEFVTAGRRGSRPLRGNCLHVLPSHYVGFVYPYWNLLRRGSRPRLTSLLRLAASG
jgi:hypothetical protein